MISYNTDMVHKQRIFFYGKNAKSMLDYTSSILQKVSRPYDILTHQNEENHFLEAPILLTTKKIESLTHHILVVGVVMDERLQDLTEIVDQTPKAGTIIYCKDDWPVAEICECKRPDVKLITYTGLKEPTQKGENLAGIRASTELLKRLRVNEDDFKDDI